MLDKVQDRVRLDKARFNQNVSKMYLGKKIFIIVYICIKVK
jgi:hypothetical protein